ncbi:MAG: sulfotransferase domain-containing protein [Oscillochloris sp.]|nr:sulfotransferase domain-containing protein [Oscillochloris sp.]
MIVISSSLPKSGSTLIANYQEDLLQIVEPRNGQQQLRKAFGGRFIGSFSAPTIARLLALHARYGSIVIKTHASVNPLIAGLIRARVAVATYCYRDPRDVILSSIDHGVRTRRGDDPSGAFREFETVENSLPLVQGFVDRWKSWHRFGQAHFIRYETLMADKLGHLKAMADYMNWWLPEDQLAELVDRHDPKKRPGGSYNFNKGTTYRYKTEMSPEDIARCSTAFGDILSLYDY